MIKQVRRKALSIVLALCMVLGLLPQMTLFASAAVWSGNKDTAWGADYASETNFTITTAAELAQFAALVKSGDSFSGKTVTLSADIALNDTTNWESWNDSRSPGNEWTAIGNDSYAFAGTFNGDGYTVSGIYISGTNSYQGLFGKIGSGGTVKNVGVTDSNISGSSYVGGVVGLNSGGTVTNCYNTGNVSGASNVGGVVGKNVDATVKNCYNAGSISGSSNVGGIIGDNAIVSRGVVAYCYYDSETSNVSGGIRGSDSDGKAVGKSTEWMKNATNEAGITDDASTFDGWSTDVWTFEAGAYPQLKPYVATDETTPTVDSLTPSGTDEATSGDIVITFSEEMDTNTAGTVTLDNSGGTLTAGTTPWSSSNTVYTIPYTGLAEDTTYTITISGFQDAAGNVMSDDNTHSFTTATGGDTWDGSLDTNWGQSAPYEISTAAQLAQFAVMVNDGDDFSGKTVTLTASINLSGNDWMPIGTSDNKFAGIFDGDGKTVSGITTISTNSYQGLFGYIVSGGTVKNVGVTDSNISGNNYVGGVVGINSQGTVTNCYNGSSVNASISYVGGVVGYNNGGTVTNCYNTGGVGATSTSNYVGGVVGYNNGAQATVSCCYSTGNVSNGNYVGGVTGYNFKGTVTNCYNTGVISGVENVGGVTGFNSSATVSYCYNAGGVSGNYIGGVAGKNTGTVTGCYYDSTTSNVSGGINGIYALGATGKSTEWMKNATNETGITDDASTFDGWSTDVWTFEAGAYPQLKSYVATDTTKPTIISVSPSHMGVPTSGDIEITFSEAMDTNIEGAVSLDNGVGTLSGGDWSDDTTYTISYAGLTVGTAYTITISGFQDAAGNEMDSDAAHCFTTAAVSTFTVTFNSQSGSAVDAIAGVSSGATITAPTSPTRSGYTFGGWYTEAACTTAWSFAGDTVSADITLYAKWTKNSSGGSSSSGNTTTSNGAEVIVNGKTQTAGTAANSTNSNGQAVTTVTVNTDKLQTILNQQGTGASVVVPVTGGSDVAKGVLTGKMVKSIENKEATLEIQTDSASYTLPASEIDIDAVSQQLGTDVNLSDITVSIQIAESTQTETSVVADAATEGGFSIQVPPVDFTITCTYGDQAVEVSSFDSYVQRRVAIPEGVDPNQITTAIVTNEDGSVRHVPTYVIKEGDTYYAVINSLTNSTYTVVSHPVEFADVTTSWAKDAVNDMGSRMIVTGVSADTYEPDRSITRAEFSAIMVRALGLAPGDADTDFADVSSSAWYAGYVETAASYGLIKGYDTGDFGPNDTITREQAMTMLARAMKITGLTADVSGTTLSPYADAGSISSYAQESVETCIAAGLVAGRSDSTLAPKDSITRAEVAVIVQRLLQNSGLID